MRRKSPVPVDRTPTSDGPSSRDGTGEDNKPNPTKIESQQTRPFSVVNTGPEYLLPRGMGYDRGNALVEDAKGHPSRDQETGRNGVRPREINTWTTSRVSPQPPDPCYESRLTWERGANRRSGQKTLRETRDWVGNRVWSRTCRRSGPRVPVTSVKVFPSVLPRPPPYSGDAEDSLTSVTEGSVIWA